jgi:hypothetical protein
MKRATFDSHGKGTQMTNPTFELFDHKAKFVRPSSHQIMQLDPDTRTRFEAVEAAADESEAAIANVKAANVALTAAIAHAAATEKRARTLRPKVREIDAIRAAIAAQNR